MTHTSIVVNQDQQAQKQNSSKTHRIYAYLLESAHISAMAYCIKVEVDITKRTSFGLKKICLRGNTIWHEPCKVSKFSHENKARAWTKIKNYFMRLTGMKKLIFNFVHALALFSWLNYETLQGSCQIVLPRRSIFFRPKLVLLLMSTSSLMQ